MSVRSNGPISQYVDVEEVRRATLISPDLQGRPCYAGLDLGATRDMTALVLVFAGDDGEFDIVPLLLVAR